MSRILSLPPAVVTGVESIGGLQTARILSRRGVPVIGVINLVNAPFSRTRICRDVIFAPPDDLARALCEIGPTLEARAVLVPCTDRDVLQVLANRDVLKQWFHVVLPDGSITTDLMDKGSFLQFALEHGLPVPPTTHLVDRKRALGAAQELRFPAVIKPAVRDSRWDSHTSTKAYKVADIEAFISTYDAVSSWSDDLIAQEWIEGEEEQLYSCNAYFDADSRPLVTFVSRKIRQWPPQTGRSALAEECRNDEVRDTTIRLFTAAKFYGLAYLEMKRDDRDGQHYIIEPNVGRPTGRSAIAEAGGVDLLFTMYCDVVGLPLPDTRHQKYMGAKWIYLRWDLQASLSAVLEGSLSLREWRRSVSGRKFYAAFDWRDPLPFLFDFLQLLPTLTHRLRRRLPAVARLQQSEANDSHMKSERETQ